ncbi:MAG: amidohydrolase family protein [Treponema sp.]|jgi:predicted TIM-barrel fold metal-dependent hydrolase|nr:amidohydrolase family protein [Treponema sp.]
MIIDFHSHIYPEKIAPKAIDSIGGFYGIPMRGTGTPEDLLERGRRGGVDRFVVFSAAATPGQAPQINRYISSVCGEHPEFIGFGTLHRDMDDPAGEIERIIGLGLKGIKLHPDMQQFNIDDEKMMPLYALLEGRLPVIFHTGDYRYSWSHPSRLARVLDAFPGLVAIAAHFGGWSLFDLALEYFRNRRCYLDVSSSIPYLGMRRTEELIGIYGAGRILFGSDYPMWDPEAELARFRRLNLSEADREKILGGNAEKILSG